MGMTKMSQRRSGRREMMMRDLSMYKHFPRLAERPRPPRPPSGAATSQAPKDPMRYRRGAPAGAPAGACDVIGTHPLSSQYLILIKPAL